LGRGDWWRSASQSAPSRLSRWRIPCRASFPLSRPNRRPAPPPPKSRSSREGGDAVSAAPDYIEPVVGWRTWLVVQEGEGFRLRSVVYDALWPAAQRARRPLSPPCIHLPLAQTLQARPACSRLWLRHLCDQRSRRGRDLSRGTRLGRHAERPPGHRHRLALGSGRRVHARLACLPRLPEGDLRSDDTPRSGSGRSGRKRSRLA
jgi:hypothetical protein